MGEYIEREGFLSRIDAIIDCADMRFEPNDKCCRIGDCAACKWRETKNAIRKIAEYIPADDVRPVVRGKWTLNKDGSGTCSECGRTQKNCWDLDNWDNFCHFCGADMREES